MPCVVDVGSIVGAVALTWIFSAAAASLIFCRPASTCRWRRGRRVLDGDVRVIERNEVGARRERVDLVDAPLVGDRGLGLREGGRGRDRCDTRERPTGLAVRDEALDRAGRGWRDVFRGRHAAGVLLDIVADLVAGVRSELLGPAALGIRRHPGRWRDREPILALQQIAIDPSHAPQIVAKRQRRARADADEHALPVLARDVVDDRPALEHHLALVADHDAIARLPRRRSRTSRRRRRR